MKLFLLRADYLTARQKYHLRRLNREFVGVYRKRLRESTSRQHLNVGHSPVEAADSRLHLGERDLLARLEAVGESIYVNYTAPRSVGYDLGHGLLDDQLLCVGVAHQRVSLCCAHLRVSTA